MTGSAVCLSGALDCAPVDYAAPRRGARVASSSRRSRVGSGWVTTSSGHRLGLQYDAKTAGAVLWGKGGAAALVPNAFGLPAGPLEVGGSCSGATTVCAAVCYAAAGEAYAPGLRAMYAHNLEAVRDLLGARGWRDLARAFVEIVEASADMQRRAGIERPSFRWHSSGDILGRRHARAILEAARATPGVDHWLYTRTLEVADILEGAPGNLRAFLSADRDNIGAVSSAARAYGLPVALLVSDRLEASRLLEGLEGRAVVCPAAGGKYSSDGRAPAHITARDGSRRLERGGLAAGACSTCGLCLPGGAAASIVFVDHSSGGHAVERVARVRVRS